MRIFATGNTNPTSPVYLADYGVSVTGRNRSALGGGAEYTKTPTTAGAPGG